MAKTRTVDEALRFLRSRPGAAALSDAAFAAEVADTALGMMWKVYPWDDSLVTLPPMYMTPNEDLIEAPARVVPGDIWYLERAWLRRIGSGIVHPELKILQSLIPSTWAGEPTTISFEPQRNAFRLHPTPGESYAPPWVQVEGIYKKQHTQITSATLNTTVLPFHDHHFPVYRAALKWAHLDLLGSRDAGTAQINSRGRYAYTGALAEFFTALTKTVEQELGRAQEQVYPAEGLSLG